MPARFGKSVARNVVVVEEGAELPVGKTFVILDETNEDPVSVGPELAADLERRVAEARSGNVITLEQLWAELDAAKP